MTANTLRTFLTPLTHILVWGLFGVVFLLYPPLSGQIVFPAEFWIKQGVLFCVWVSIFYLTANVTVPQLLFRGHTGQFVLVLVFTAVAVLVFSRFLENLMDLHEKLAQAFQAAGMPPKPPRTGFRLDNMTSLTTMLVLGISTCIKVVQKWQHETRHRERLEQQEISAELSFLKAQINPHFFFNTLNNIYSLTISNGEKARTALHRLSRMMRYVLYETSSGTTRLSQEISFVLDYMELMQLRLTDRVTVTFEKPEPVHDVLIAPMLLLPFIENAFKHGVAATAASRIHIALRQPDLMTVDFEVCNTKLALPNSDLTGSNGIGLANTRRRLDLLYPGRYSLEVTDPSADNEFCVHLTLRLA
jgi:sensor histidine kinase YesM